MTRFETDQHARAIRRFDACLSGGEDFLDDLALGLSQDLGRDVASVRLRRLSAEARIAALVDELT